MFSGNSGPPATVGYMRRSPSIAAIGALSAALAAALVYLASFMSGGARWLDALALHGFLEVGDSPVRPLAMGLAHLADPAPFATLGIALAVIALVRERPRSALAVAVILVGGGITSQTLKPLLGEQRVLEIASASWPSGHATASMSLALCAVLVAPPLLRPLAAAVGVVYTLGVSYGLLAIGWHLPSDVIGGYLVAATWALAALAALWAADRRWPARSGREAAARAVAGMPATLAPSIAVLLALSPLVIAAADHRAFAAATAAIGALAVAVAAAMALALRAPR